MNTRIYFENLAVTTTEAELADLFLPYGGIATVNMAVAAGGDRPGTFGFVTMITPEGARAAIRSLNGKLIGAHTITVAEACPPEERVRSSKSQRSPRRRPSHMF